MEISTQEAAAHLPIAAAGYVTLLDAVIAANAEAERIEASGDVSAARKYEVEVLYPLEQAMLQAERRVVEDLEESEQSAVTFNGRLIVSHGACLGSALREAPHQTTTINVADVTEW
jgi:hypothetical protein